MTSARDIDALAKGGRTNVAGFVLRLAARIPFLFVAGRLYGPDLVGRFALAVVVVELAALIATLGLKRGLAQALARADRPQTYIVWDALVVALLASLIASVVLVALPGLMYPDSDIHGLDRFLPCVILAIALSDVSLAALAYRLNVKAAVTARAVVEPWTISVAAWALSFATPQSGLMLAYVASMLAAMTASLAPLLRSYGLPRGWTPRIGPLWRMASANAPLAGADAIEWGTRNVDRFILGVMFPPSIVGVYYMAQQVASLPQKLKTSFDPVLGPVITQSLAAGDRAGVARQVRQVAFWVVAAQAPLALVGSIPGRAVMAVVGPQFVSGTAAMAFLLWAEVLASTGAVCESALVYVARLRNLLLSGAMLLVQVVLSFGLIALMRGRGWPLAFQAAGPPVALLLSVTVTSLAKALLLGRELRASVSPWRWPLLWAAAAAIAVGAVFTNLPPWLAWAELPIGVPAMVLGYGAVLWRRAFRPADRALLARGRGPGDAALPLEGAATG